MHIDGGTTEALVVALAIMAHGWQGRIQANPTVLSIIGWTVNALAVLALFALWRQ